MEARADNTRGAPEDIGPPYPAGQLAQLAVRFQGRSTRMVPVSGDMHIGRDLDNDLVLDDSGVAEHHARILARNGGLFLRSEGAATTEVNGITLIGHRRLRDGDRIQLGETLVVYQATHSPSEEVVADGDDMALWSLLPGPQTATGKRRRHKRTRQARKRRFSQGHERMPGVVLTPAGLFVLVFLTAIVAYLIAPDSFQPRRTERRLTPVIASLAPAPATQASTQSAGANRGGDDRPATPIISSLATPDELASFLADAETLTLRSQFDAAIERYQVLAERVPRDVRAEVGWAWALIWDGDIDQAVIHAQEATKIDPESAQAWSVLARAYAAQGNASDALSSGRRAVALAGEAGSRSNDEVTARAHAMLAEAYLLGDLIPQAVEQADAAMRHSSYAADALSIRGRLYLLAGKDDGAAVAALERAAELEPELWVRHQELGLMLVELGQHQAAIEALTQAMVLAHKPTTYMALGRAHYALGEYDQGKSYLEQSLSLGTDDAETYALLAVMNAEQGRCEDARVYYGHAFEHDLAQPLAVQAQEICEQGTIPTGAGTAGGLTGPARTPSAPTGKPNQSSGALLTTTALPPLPGRIAFPAWNAEQGHYDTYVARPDGSDRKLVAAQMHQPAFRPDGQWLVLNGEQPLHMNLHIMRLDGGNPIEISTYLEDRLPRWSPDGEALIYSSTRDPDRQPRLYVADNVPLDGRRAEDRPVRADLYEVLGDYPTWLPDGRLVYTGCDRGSGATRCGLLTINPASETEKLQALTDYPGDTAAAAGPNGQVAFMSDRDGNWELYLLDADGSLRRLTQHAGNDGLPAWSPDGSYLAFVSDRDAGWAVWAMRPDGSGLRKLFDLGGGGLAVDWQHESISWGK